MFSSMVRAIVIGKKHVQARVYVFLSNFLNKIDNCGTLRRDREKRIAPNSASNILTNVFTYVELGRFEESV